MPRHVKTAFAAKEGVTEAVLNSWIYKYGLPVIQIGRRVYIDEDEFQSWLEQHKKIIPRVKPDRSTQIALPKQCRDHKVGILSKLSQAR